jgi:isopentenyldiphosphate isomerase
MDELLDILDSKGDYTGKIELKSQAHRMGLFHATVHVWFYTKDGAILIQQRGEKKDIHPLLWDVSVAGHIGAGEEIEISAVREVAEEIGLPIKKEQLKKIGVFKSVQKHHENLIDCEFHHTFICELQLPLNQLKKQDSEVAALNLVLIDKFHEEIQNNKRLKKYVPHESSYFKHVIQAIRKQL